MDNIASRIALFHNLYLACLIGALLFLAISIILFFKLNVRGIIGFLTGKQAEREIQRIQEETFEKNAGKKKLVPEIKGKPGLSTTQDIPAKDETFSSITITRKLEDGKEVVTDILSDIEEADEKTTLLQPSEIRFHLEREILFIHTNEIIE